MIGNIDFELIYNNINTNNIVNFEIQEISKYELVDYIVYSLLNTTKINDYEFQLCITNEGMNSFIIGYQYIDNDRCYEERENIYLYKINNIICISNYEEHAYGLYYSYLENQGLITHNDYINIINNYQESHDNTRKEVIETQRNNLKSIPSTDFSIYVEWKDKNNISHPLRNSKIEIYRNSTSLYGTYYSNNNGYVSVSIPSTLVGSSVSCKVYASGRKTTINNTNGVEVYSVETYNNIVKGNSYQFDFTFTNRVYEVAQAINTAAEFGRLINSSIPNLTVQYPSTGVTIANADFINNILHIREIPNVVINTYENWDLLTKAYGIHFFKSLNACEYEYCEELIINIIDIYEKEDACKIAWSNGLGALYGNIAQNYYSNYLSTISHAADGIYTSRTYSINIANNSTYYGETCSLTVLGVLNRLYEEIISSQSNTITSFNTILNLITQNTPDDLNEFNDYINEDIDDINNDTGITISLLEDIKEAYNYALIEYKIGATDPHTVNFYNFVQWYNNDYVNSDDINITIKIHSSLDDIYNEENTNQIFDHRNFNVNNSNSITINSIIANNISAGLSYKVELYKTSELDDYSTGPYKIYVYYSKIYGPQF